MLGNIENKTTDINKFYQKLLPTNMLYYFSLLSLR